MTTQTEKSYGTPSYKDLCNLVGIKNHNNLLPIDKKQDSFAHISYELWVFFNDFISAETSFSKHLNRMEGLVIDQQIEVKKGYMPIASWIVQCAQDIEKDQIDMTNAVKNIRKVTLIYKLMLEENEGK